MKGEILAATNEPEQAQECFNQVLSLNPFNEKAYILSGELYLVNKDFDKALAVYDEAIEINPNFAKAYHERGRIKLLKGDKDGSVEDMKKAIELAPENEMNISGQYNNYENMTKNVLLFIYIQNKQKTHERKRTVLEIFPYHHYTGIRTYFIYKNVSFHRRYFRSMHHLHHGKKTNVLSYPRKTFQKKYYSHFTLDRSHHVLSCTFIIGCMVTDQ